MTDTPPSAPAPELPALELVGLDKSFGGLHATDHVSFAIAAGSVTALIGPNGAGKTTLFNLITNLLPLGAGRILLHGTDITGLPAVRIAGLGLIRTFQTARVFPGMTVLENLLAGGAQASRRGAGAVLAQMLFLPRAARQEAALRARARALLDAIGLAHCADMAATDLPMGAQKLLEVGRALMARPRVLLLDEPAAGLNDSETMELANLLRAIREAGVTLMLVEHNMALVMGVADQVVVLDAGRLVASGKPEDIQRDPRVLEAYIGTEIAA